ncbi:aminotransferase class I/II-fold pyridoxal phosphate-dependent enzyme [Nocardia sp. NBC_01499]|uniref:pyridoxal phosphate-dependent aminotransferase n=1 Tax=Nocardia sp. NBC_01499 TaxID=2903597 RepID=UPI003869E085
MTVGRVWGRAQLLALAIEHGHVPLDLSLGIAADPEPVPADEPRAGTAQYPPSRGRAELLAAVSGYLARRFDVSVPVDSVAVCVGAKEFIASAPLFLRDSRVGADTRDTVLIPALGYPPYELGARLAGLRPYRVPVDAEFRMRLDRLPEDVAARALCLWVNSPANPTGVLEPLTRCAEWGRERGVLVLSDEAYADTTWSGPPRTILAGGPDGVLAVHSLSKRSNAPGLRVASYSGDRRVVEELADRRRAAGLMAADSAQARAALLFGDDRHAAAQQVRNRRRVAELVAELNANGLPCTAPEGGLFVWLRVPDRDAAAFVRDAAIHAGIVLAQGDSYGPAGHAHVRIAAVRDRAEVAPRLALLSEQLVRVS